MPNHRHLEWNGRGRGECMTVIPMLFASPCGEVGPSGSDLDRGDECRFSKHDPDLDGRRWDERTCMTSEEESRHMYAPIDPDLGGSIVRLLGLERSSDF